MSLSSGKASGKTTVDNYRKHMDAADKRIKELEAELHTTRQLLFKKQAEVERVIAWVCPLDMTLCRIHIHEGGGRETEPLSAKPRENGSKIDDEMLRNEAAQIPFPAEWCLLHGKVDACFERAAANPAAPDTSGEASPTRVASPPLVDTHEHDLFFDDPTTGKHVSVHHSAICWCKVAARKERDDG